MLVKHGQKPKKVQVWACPTKAGSGSSHTGEFRGGVEVVPSAGCSVNSTSSRLLRDPLLGIEEVSPFYIESFFFFFLIFLLHHVACGNLVPWPGIEPMPLALEAWSLNHSASRKPLELFWPQRLESNL